MSGGDKAILKLNCDSIETDTFEVIIDDLEFNSPKID